MGLSKTSYFQWLLDSLIGFDGGLSRLQTWHSSRKAETSTPLRQRHAANCFSTEPVDCGQNRGWVDAVEFPNFSRTDRHQGTHPENQPNVESGLPEERQGGRR